MKQPRVTQPKVPPVAAYSRNRAAEILGWSARTLVRRTEDGVIARRPDGRFERDEVERVLALALSDDDDLELADPNSNQVQSLRMFQQAQGHAERMVKLLEQPIGVALQLLTDMAKAMSERDVLRDKAHLEFLEAAGQLFLNKAERDAMLLEAQAKADAMRSVGGQLSNHLPQLLSQITGTKAAEFGDVKKFVDMLDDNDRAGLLALREFLDGDEKKAAYMKLLKTIGVKTPEVPGDEQKAAE